MAPSFPGFGREEVSSRADTALSAPISPARFHPANTPGERTAPGTPGGSRLRLLMGLRDRLMRRVPIPLAPASILRKTLIFQKPPVGWRLSGGFPSQSAVLVPLGFQPQATGLRRMPEV